MSKVSPAHLARFRFHGELNEFLPVQHRGQSVIYRFDHHPGIKDPVEALGVPHTEVMMLTVNGGGVGFDYRLCDGDRVEVYPVFIPSDVEKPVLLRAELPDPHFVLDVHLGKLARWLRLLGLDVLYRNDYTDPELADISAAEHRILLTRDRRLLFYRRVTYGHFIRDSDPFEQVRDVIRHYQLKSRLQPFSRCIKCNGRLETVHKNDILDRLEPKTIQFYDTFYRCADCGQIYWQGSHLNGISKHLKALGCDIRSL